MDLSHPHHRCNDLGIGIETWDDSLKSGIVIGVFGDGAEEGGGFLEIVVAGGEDGVMRLIQVGGQTFRRAVRGIVNKTREVHRPDLRISISFPIVGPGLEQLLFSGGVAGEYKAGIVQGFQKAIGLGVDIIKNIPFVLDRVTVAGYTAVYPAQQPQLIVTGRSRDDRIIGGGQRYGIYVRRIAAAPVGIGREVFVAHIAFDGPGELEEIEVSVTSLEGDPFLVDTLCKSAYAAFRDERGIWRWCIRVRLPEDLFFAGSQ